MRRNAIVLVFSVFASNSASSTSGTFNQTENRTNSTNTRDMTKPKSIIKRCNSCNVEKSLREFHKHHGQPDGRQAVCKGCACAWQRAYNATPRGAYQRHKADAKKRHIQFLLTFKQWWSIWESHWDERGHGKDKLVMGRHGDAGPYVVGNVEIITHAQNVKDGARYRKRRRDASHRKQSAATAIPTARKAA